MARSNFCLGAFTKCMTDNKRMPPDVSTGVYNHHSDPIDPTLIALVEAYRPRQTEHWKQVRPLVTTAVLAAQPPSWPVAQPMLKAAYEFIVWTWQVAGAELDLDALFTGRNIHRYIEKRSGRRPVRHDRTDLNHLARIVEGISGQRPASPRHDRSTPRPYSQAELAAVCSFAATLRTPRMRATASAIIALGAGAGLRTAEIEQLRGSDIHDDHVQVRGPVPRQVPTHPAWRAEIARLGRAGDDHVVLADLPRGERPGKLVRGFLDDLERGRPSPGRLRSTWIVSLLDAPLGVAALIHIAGINSCLSLDYYRPYMPKVTLDASIQAVDALTTGATR